MAAAATGRTQLQPDEAPTSLLSATTAARPATVFVAAGLLVPLAILFRYSFNVFEPRRMMVETFSLDNYVKFFSDPYYTGVLWTTLRVAALCNRRLPRHGSAAGLRAGAHPSRDSRMC